MTEGISLVTLPFFLGFVYLSKNSVVIKINRSFISKNIHAYLPLPDLIVFLFNDIELYNSTTL